MTSDSDSSLLFRLAVAMTTSLSVRDRAERLAVSVHQALPCDAVCLLLVEAQELRPIAAVGLAPDLLGHRFRRSDEPRLDIACAASGPVRFPAECDLRDPYDGFVLGVDSLTGRVHSCLACPLRVDDRLLGVLTLDALSPDRFDAIDDAFLEALAALTAAALQTSELIATLEQSAKRQGFVARDLVRDELDRQGGILVGNSAAMTKLRDEVQLIARSQFPVLVTGETGVGKELIVRTLHAQSSRRDQVLVYVNCAALPESIVESELFGHARHAFTGAQEARLGKFQVADGASLFLDEIGELPLHVQPKLLRVLQEGEVQSVGSDRPIHVDVRVFAATNRDLECEVENGRFRKDLLYRLDVCRLHVPPLRDHAGDVALLAGHFADTLRRQLGTGRIRIGPEALRALARHRWPGNVRELRNVLARAVLRAAARCSVGDPVVVSPGDLGLDVDGDVDGGASVEPRPDQVQAREAVPLREAVIEFQRALIEAALERAGQNWAEAARSLGMHRSNLHHLAKRLGLKL